MTDEIIEPNEPTDNNVNVGSNLSLSVKQVQQIYAEITGRTESLEKSYQINHAAKFEDLNQLNIKISQSLGQYNVVGRSCNVTLFHTDDQKQEFSSFERFNIYDKTTLSPVENVRIQYHFLILLPQLNKPQSYKIEVDLHSRAAIISRAKKEAGIRSMVLFEFFAPSTGSVSIEYIDYTVARTMLGVVDQWFHGLPEVDSSQPLLRLKKVAPHLPFFFRAGLILPFLWICHAHFSVALAAKPTNAAAVFSASVATFGGMMLMYIFSSKLGSAASDAIKRIQARSFLDLTRGDEIAFTELRKSNRNAWLQTGGSIVAAFLAKTAAYLIIHNLGV